MSWIRKARAAGGFISILVMLTMILGSFLFKDLHISNREIFILASLVSALLGVDVVVTQKERIAKSIAAAVNTYTEEYEDNEQ